MAVRTAPTRIIGRDRQLAELTEIWDRVRAGTSTTVLLGGDAGVGKTTLVDAFCERQGDARIIRGQSVPLGGEGLAYAPIIGALRDLTGQVGGQALLGWSGPGASTVARLLPELAGAANDTDDDRLRLLEAVTDVLEGAAIQRPLIAVIEDVHWADSSTRDVLAFASRALTDAPLLVIATYRTDELHRRHPLRPFIADLVRLPNVSQLDVPRLDRTGVAELLGDLLGRSPGTADVDEIHRRSDGIPFFVEELARTDCCDLPEGLRNVLIVRFEALSPEAQDTVRRLAIAGNRAEHELVAALSEHDPAALAAALREAVDGLLLVVDGSGYRFRHALLREAVLDDLLPGEQTALHRRLAAVIEATDNLVPPERRAVELAHHWYRAHDLHEAFRWAIAAARARVVDQRESLRLYERALELWDQVAGAEDVAGPHTAVLEAAADAANDSGELQRALGLLDSALAETDERSAPIDAARLLRKKGRLLTNLNRFGGVETLQRAATLIPAQPPSKERAAVLDVLAAMQMMEGEGVAAIATARQAIDAAIAARATDPEASARITLASCVGSLGDLPTARSEFANALSLRGDNAKLLGRYHVNYSDVLRIHGAYAEAADLALKGTEVAADLGLKRTIGTMLAGNAAEPLLFLGDWERAHQLIDRALELDPPAHHRIHLKTLHALLLVGLDELADADRTLAELRPLLLSPQAVPQYVTLVALSEAEYRLAIGQPGRAWNAAKASLDQRQRQAVGSLWWVARAAAQAVGTARTSEDGPPFDVDAATAYLGDLLIEFDAVTPSAEARALVEAELGTDLALWNRAVEALAAAEGPVHQRAYVHLRRAEFLAPTDRRAAMDALAAAGDVAGAIGARLLQRRIDDLRRRFGLRSTTPPVAVDGPAPLTPREREVLRLVAHGRTNGEIGAELFISTKTASVHVSNILAKLGVSSRIEAAAVALRELRLDDQAV